MGSSAAGLAREWVDILEVTELSEVTQLEKGVYYLVPASPDTFPAKVGINELASGLPLLAMGRLLFADLTLHEHDGTAGPSSQHARVTSVFQAISSLCWSGDHIPQLKAQVLTDDSFCDMLMDAVDMVLLTLAGPAARGILEAATRQDTVQAAVDSLGMLAAALRALTYAGSARRVAPGGEGEPTVCWHAVAEAVCAAPRGPIFFAAAFDAVRLGVRAVHAAVLGGEVRGPALEALAFHVGAAMELLSYLAATPLFYQRLMLCDAPCAAPLRLVLACLTLHAPPLAVPPWSWEGPGRLVPGPEPHATAAAGGGLELLAARGLALLLTLAEPESPAFTAAAAAGPGAGTARAVGAQTLLAAAALLEQVLLRPPSVRRPAAPGEAQLAVNALRCAERLADDAEHRARLARAVHPALAQLLAQDPAAFADAWCAGAGAEAYFTRDDVLVDSVGPRALAAAEALDAAVAVGGDPGEEHGEAVPGGGGPTRLPARRLALERALLLFRLLVNLDYVPPPSDDAGAAGGGEGGGRVEEGRRPSRGATTDPVSPRTPSPFLEQLLRVLASLPAPALSRAAANVGLLGRAVARLGPGAAPRPLLSMQDLELGADLEAALVRAAQGGGNLRPSSAQWAEPAPKRERLA
uniref:Uncharacterized protein n=2 Tax=Auxenochlorella protothecoides TaxID=3075 RepID=A0A1D2A955_AUXPR